MTNIANFLRIILPILLIFAFFHSISARFEPSSRPKPSDCAFADRVPGRVFADKASPLLQNDNKAVEKPLFLLHSLLSAFQSVLITYKVV